jgi:hypothetical protein
VTVPEDRVTIDAARAITLLREVVAEKGADYRYQKVKSWGSLACLYVHDGSCSCLVGHALHHAGVPTSELNALDFYGNDDGDTGIAQVYGRLPDRFQLTGHAVEVLAAAQNAQDDGLSWGEALSAAEEIVAVSRDC